MAAHKKMAREERAKQFMPFAALKGYEEALRREEAVVEARFEERLTDGEEQTAGVPQGVSGRDLLQTHPGRAD